MGKKLEEIFWDNRIGFRNSKGKFINPKPIGATTIIKLTINDDETDIKRIEDRVNIDASYRNLGINAYLKGLSAHNSTETAIQFYKI